MMEGEHLLKLKPEDSLNLMLTNANQLRYPIYGLKAGEPQSVDGVRTRVRLSGRDPVAKDDVYPYRGEVVFEFNRLDVSQFFENALEDFRPTLPTSTQEILNELTFRTGIEFDIHDMVHENIGRTQSVAFNLKAKQESLRWTGNITLRLSDLESLTDLLATPPTMLFDAATPRVVDLNLAAPHSNVSPLLRVNGEQKIQALVENQEVQNMQVTSRDLVRDLFAFQHATGPVVIQATPAANNLYGAKILDKALVDLNDHPNRLNSNLNRLMRLELDPTRCLQVTNPIVYLRYSLLDNVPRQIRPFARLVNSGGVSPFDGSAYASFLSTLQVGQIITATPAMELEAGGPLWQTSSTTPSPTNLYRAVVQANGPRRPQDNTSLNRALTHLLTVTVSEEYNTQWRGNLHIYYQGAD